ncbi:MAG TPA: type II toxin-antitoxin system HicA family toxin [Chloroflexi bacterium]|nr:type II toxin-antitoxin system HicA family toxin [Chloroflexota bacterium]
MSKLPQLSGRECVSVLERYGFRIVRQRGSHIVMRRDQSFAQVVVPDHKEIDRGALRAIVRQAGLQSEDFA